MTSMLFQKQCPKCIAYIQDTLAHPLPLSHPLRDSISYKHLHRIEHELSTGMERIIKDYFGHKNLVLRLIREHRAQLGSTIPLCYERIYSAIVQWYALLYSDLKANKKRKHPFQIDMECLGVLAVETGLIRGKTKNPLSIFQDWYMEYYIHFLEHLEDIHQEHDGNCIVKQKKGKIVESKWDRSNLDNLYD